MRRLNFALNQTSDAMSRINDAIVRLRAAWEEARVAGLFDAVEEDQ